MTEVLCIVCKKPMAQNSKPEEIQEGVTKTSYFCSGCNIMCFNFEVSIKVDKNMHSGKTN